MRTNITKRTVWTLVAGVICIRMFACFSVEAASSRKLSAGSKTLSVGQEYTIKLKGLSKKDKKSRKTVCWSITDKRKVVFKKKGKYSVTVRARETGTAKITGIYRGKKYTCKIAVGNTDDMKKSEENDTHGDASSEKINLKLNASDVTLYYLADEDKAYISRTVGHDQAYQFKVSGKSDDDVHWSIAESESPFKADDDGKVYLWRDPAGLNEEKPATLVVKLSDGTVLKAKLHGYSERGIAVKKRMDEFADVCITDDMTEYEKMETIAKYVEYEYDYVMY